MLEREVMTIPASEAQIRANAKYNLKAYDRVELKIPKGKKTDLQEHATKMDESLNGFVNRAIDETVKRDNEIFGGEEKTCQ